MSDTFEVSPVPPENPENVHGWEKDRKNKGGGWRGCNHCGRTVPQKSSHIEWRNCSYGGQILYMHHWCFMKLYERDYIKALFGRDIFGDD